VVLDALLDHVGDALTASGDLEVVRQLVDGVRRRGTGAVWQRAGRAEGRSWPALVRAAIAETVAPLTLP
jgi:carboxylate-amine ligase